MPITPGLDITSGPAGVIEDIPFFPLRPLSRTRRAKVRQKADTIDGSTTFTKFSAVTVINSADKIPMIYTPTVFNAESGGS